MCRRDLGPEPRHNPAKKTPPTPVPRHEPLRRSRAIGSDEDEPPPAKNHCPANPPRYPVGNRRTQPRTERPGQYDAAEAHPALCGPERGGWNHNFTGHRKDGAFHRHQRDHPEIATVAHPAEPHLQQAVKHLSPPSPPPVSCYGSWQSAG